MDNFHGVLIITDQTPVGDYLRPDRFRFDVINDVVDMPLKGFRFEVCFAKRTEGIYAQHNLVAILAMHEGKGIELAVKRTDRIDGAVARLRFKKRTDIEIVVRF